MRDLLGFIGVDQGLFDYKPLPPGMKVGMSHRFTV